jgi:DNA-nicking Smr family endonuclease
MRKRHVSDKSLPPVERVSETQLRRTEAEIRDQNNKLPEIDLHGQNALEAAAAVQDFITRQSAESALCCRIMHGKGTGVLEQVVIKEIKELMKQGIIEAYFPSQRYEYAGAAVVAVFKP